MSEKHLTPYELWHCLAVSRGPLVLILNPRLIDERKNRVQFTLSDSAYVHRMFDLFFSLDFPPLMKELTEAERIDLQRFLDEFKSLGWRPIESHPHISELSEPAKLVSLMGSAKILDKRLKRRVSVDPLSVVYRFFKGWRVSRPARES